MGKAGWYAHDGSRGVERRMNWRACKVCMGKAAWHGGSLSTHGSEEGFQDTTLSQRRTGSILILTLWTIFFLAALAVAVSSYVELNVVLASEAGGGTRAYFCALAGVETARQVAFADTNEWDGAGEAWFDSADLFKEVKCGEGYFSLIGRIMRDGNVVTNYGLTDEEGRININKADEPLLAAMWQMIGGADNETATELTHAVLDWRDPGDDPLTQGAESSYYASLDPPYKCHNDEFVNLHELLLVKGVTCELFSRVRPYLTVYGEGKVNINTASAPVLRCVARASGADDEVSSSLAGKIAAFTQSGRRFEEADDAAVRRILKDAGGLTDKEGNVLSRIFVRLKINSDYLRGSSYGMVPGGAKFGRVIEFVLRKADGSLVLWLE